MSAALRNHLHPKALLDVVLRLSGPRKYGWRPTQRARWGASVCVGDGNGDGFGDVGVGAPFDGAD